MEENENRRSALREISRNEMNEVFEKAALAHEGGVYRLPLLDLCEDDKGIAIFSKEYTGVIAISWDALISIKHKPAEGEAPETLTFTMPYAVVTIVLEENRHES